MSLKPTRPVAPGSEYMPPQPIDFKVMPMERFVTLDIEGQASRGMFAMSADRAAALGRELIEAATKVRKRASSTE